MVDRKNLSATLTQPSPMRERDCLLSSREERIEVRRDLGFILSILLIPSIFLV